MPRGEGSYFTKFGTDKGPGVGFPEQINENFGAQTHWVGEMDPARQNPLNLEPNMIEKGVNDSTVWGIQTGSQYFGDSLL